MKYIDKKEKEIMKSYNKDEWISSENELKETIVNSAKKFRLKIKENQILAARPLSQLPVRKTDG